MVDLAEDFQHLTNWILNLVVWKAIYNFQDVIVGLMEVLKWLLFGKVHNKE